MDSIKKCILVSVPMSICNLRCHYCYLSQRDECYQNEQIKYQFAPEIVGKAFSQERLGGVCYFNFCADGETLLAKDILLYIKAVLDQGHYVEIVSNMTITKIINEILKWDKDTLSRMEFKCSFHYVELMKKNLLLTFIENVNNSRKAGCSINIEITPSDELVEHINDVKKVSIENFGAMPHLTIARRDDTEGIEYLTNLSMDKYDEIWSQFGSEFWAFKKQIFGVKRIEFCCAGERSIYVNLATGQTTQCYFGYLSQNIFKDINKKIKFVPIGKCSIAHCYNGHALLTLGCIPNFTKIGYGDIRDRECIDGSHWLNEKYKKFVNTKLDDTNKAPTTIYKVSGRFRTLSHRIVRKIKTTIKR